MEITVRSIFNMIIFPSIIILHVSNNVIIARTKCLHKIVYYILVNVSVSDVFVCVAVFIQNIQLIPCNVYLHISYTTFYTSSILSTLFITVDRYIAVVHCLHYRQIATKRRVLLSIAFIWIISFLFSVFPAFLSSNYEYRLFLSDVIHCPIYLISSILLVCSSLLIRYIRNKHVLAIKKRNIYFGIEDERLGMLQNLKLAVLDVIRLNFVTAFLVFVGNIVDMFDKYYCKRRNTPLVIISIIFRASYMITNPIVYILAMTELKEQYGKVVSCISLLDSHKMIADKISPALELRNPP